MTGLNDVGYKELASILTMLDESGVEFNGTAVVANATVVIEFKNGSGEHFGYIEDEYE